MRNYGHNLSAASESGSAVDYCLSYSVVGAGINDLGGVVKVLFSIVSKSSSRKGRKVLAAFAYEFCTDDRS